MRSRWLTFGLLLVALAALAAASRWLRAGDPPPPAPTNASQPALDRLLEDGRIDAARALVRQDLEANPESWRAWRARAEVEINAGDLKEGLSAALRAVSLAGDESLEPHLTLLSVQMHADPAGAVRTARDLERLGLSRERAATLQAEAAIAEILHDDVVDEGEKARIRTLIASLEGLDGSQEARLGHLEQMGHLHFLLGDMARAAACLAAPVREGPQRGSRAASSALALGWTCFLQGDEKGAAEAYTVALKRLADKDSLRNFTGRSTLEAVVAYRVAFSGREPTKEELEAIDSYSAALAERGLEEWPALRFNRERWRLAWQAWDRRDYPQAYALLASRLEEFFDTDKEPVRRIQLGATRTKVGGFFVKMVDLREAAIGPAVFLGDLAGRTGRPRAAAFWYRLALQQVPGNPILLRRLAALPQAGAGDVEPEEAVPPKEDTLEALARMAHEGASVALHLGVVVPGADLFGPSYVDCERLVQDRSPVYLQLLEALDSSLAALEQGKKFQPVDLSRPPYEVKPEDGFPAPPAVQLDYAPGRKLLMVLVDGNWMVWVPHVPLPATTENLH